MLSQLFRFERDMRVLYHFPTRTQQRKDKRGPDCNA